jgi:hypothetical protein
MSQLVLRIALACDLVITTRSAVFISSFAVIGLILIQRNAAVARVF